MEMENARLIVLPCGAVWLIISTLTPASEMAVRISAAMRLSLGISGSVTSAMFGQCVIFVMTCSYQFSSATRWVMLYIPGARPHKNAAARTAPFAKTSRE